MKLDELKVGDRIKGFDGWGCVPNKAIRIVRSCDSGLFVKCSDGIHLLDGQEGDDGHLVGLSRA